MELKPGASGETFLSGIARAIKSKVEGDKVPIPAALGRGYFQGFAIHPQLRVMIRRYELKKNLTFKVPVPPRQDHVIMIAFHNVFRDALTRDLPYVRVASADFDAELFIPANTTMNAVIIAIYASHLKELLTPQNQHGLLEAVTSARQPFLFEEILSPRIQDVASEMMDEQVAAELRSLYRKIKVEELIYLLFVELLKRENGPIQSLKPADVKMLYAIKEKLLSSLDSPPGIDDLARLSGMSESKLKRLFRQVFGDSIYNYYQSFRMKEAARLLKEEKLSVSEAGYRLGFSNLSHFSRVFEQHTGLKPKKYSKL